MAAAGVSTLGVTCGIGVETTAGTKPTDFDLLTRINAIGGISLETEQIDASALEDFITRYEAGRQDTGGNFTVTVNLTTDTITEWEDAITAYNTAKTAGKATWFEICHPNFTNGWFVTVQLPQELPMPEFAQNELLKVEIPLIISEYKGMSSKVAPK